MAKSPVIQSIDPGRPFLDTLAAGLLEETGGRPEALADMLVLLPTRRACRALGEAFLRVGKGRALILPAIRPLGDVEEEGLALRLGPGDVALALPPAIPEMRRQLLLTGMILARKGDLAVTAEQAARLASELARLVDQVHTERLDFARLDRLVPAEHAEHWGEVIDFLKLVTEFWPKILADEGYLDPADRRNRLLEAQARLWREAPPAHPVVVAGSTGSIPATADLLEVVAALPAGRIVLPGLDRGLDAATAEAALEEPTHPQHGMLRLLARLGVTVEAVGAWDGGIDAPAPSSPPERSRLVAEALRPAATTEAWRHLGALQPAALAGLERVDCAIEAEEAGVIALMLRHALEEDGRTAALVTPDRQLARRVAAELGRWDIAIDDSAGRPLADTPPGVFLRLVARAAADEFAPVALLAVLKHPLAAGGMDRRRFRDLARGFDRILLRGARPGAGIAGLSELIDEDPEAGKPFRPLLGAIEACFSGLAAALERESATLVELIDAHLAAAEALAATGTEEGARRLWAGDDGEALADTIAELRLAAPAMKGLDGADYPALFETLIGGATFRPRYGRHPRLHIWGPLEARLLHADLTILGGLNEGIWPPDPGNDPWMSRPMRAEFGLPAPERRIGMAAHDFAQGFAAPRVALVRAARAEGAPTVPSRWLTRLDTVLAGCGQADGLRPAKSRPSLYHAQARPDRPERIAPPEPRPPVAARPRRLSVTQIETWMGDPYAIFARHILRLRALDPLEADPGAADRGSFIHEALDAFVSENPGKLPADSLARLMRCGERAFGTALARPAVRAFWWPRFQRIAEWFLEQERERRATLIKASTTETRGEIALKGPAGPFVLSAKADRIDTLRDGGYAIVDYKTGLPPSDSMVELGYAPQLPLEAAILAAGGFPGIEAGPTVELAYWRLSGGDPAGNIHTVKGDANALSQAARDGLLNLIARFDDPATAYLSTPRPEWAPAWNDYVHLARTAEWSAGGGDGEE